MKDLITFGIVEDEWIESKAMSCYIERNFPNTRILFQEEDGLSGLSAVRQNPPDILIVDIEMPIMNGLELCEHLYRDQYEGVILINTAYDKFSYAKRAIGLKVFDYMVKPVTNEDLFDCLSRCIDESVRRSSARRHQSELTQSFQNMQQYAFSLISENPTVSDHISRFFDAVGWSASDQSQLQTYVIHFSCALPFSADQRRVFQSVQTAILESCFFVSSGYQEETHFILMLQPRYPLNHSCLYTLVWCGVLLLLGKEKHIYARVSPLCADYSAVSQEFHTAFPVSDSLSSSLQERIQIPARTWLIIRRKDREKYRSMFERYFRDQLHDSVRKTLSEIPQRYTFDSLDALWETVQLLLEAMCNVWDDLPLTSLLSRLFQSLASSPSGADHSDSSSVGHYLDEIASFCQSLPPPQTGDSIDYVLQYMKTSFDQDITQASIAEMLGLDPAYFSRLFKKRTSRNFSDVLMEIRMQHAEKMLLEKPDCSLEELCRGCGLSSKTYFSEVFKKWKGITITQFLKNQSP